MLRKSYEISHPEYMQIIRAGETLYGCDQDWYKVEWRRRAGCGPVAATNILIYLRKRFNVGNIPYRNGSVKEALEAMDDAFLFVRPRRHGLNTVKRFVKGMSKFGRSYGLSFRYRYLVVPPQADMRPSLGEVIGFVEEGLKNDVPVAFLNLHAGSVEAQLSSWHWVTVVGLDKYAAAGGARGVADCEADVADCEPGDAGDVRGVADCEADVVGCERGVADCEPDVAGCERGVADCEPDVAGCGIILRYYDQSKYLKVNLSEWLNSTEWGGGFAYFHRPVQRPVVRVKS